MLTDVSDFLATDEQQGNQAKKVAIDNATVGSLLLMSSVKQDTQEHRVDLKDINSKVERLENKVDRLEESMQQLNLAITTLMNSQRMPFAFLQIQHQMSFGNAIKFV